jgi:hypothetical protein
VVKLKDKGDNTLKEDNKMHDVDTTKYVIHADRVGNQKVRYLSPLAWTK